MAFANNNLPQGLYWDHDDDDELIITISDTVITYYEGSSDSGDRPIDSGSQVENVNSDEALNNARAMLYGEEETTDFRRSFQQHFQFIVGMNQGELANMQFARDTIFALVGLIEEILNIMNGPGSFDHLVGKEKVEGQLKALKDEMERLNGHTSIFYEVWAYSDNLQIIMFRVCISTCRVGVLALDFEGDPQTSITLESANVMIVNFAKSILSMRKYLFRLRTTLQKKLDNDSMVLGGRLWDASKIQARLVIHADQIRAYMPSLEMIYDELAAIH
ncbi:hypothetical protein F5Y06DRAFT_302361 [Hypoxylon sp. FL0890]|nr:hypothetical protein F5Y06DRAFT_302361 [Hypoxylon sp. FL0890]